jgi:hypothetical protein
MKACFKRLIRFVRVNIIIDIVLRVERTRGLRTAILVMMCCYWPMTYLKNDPKLRQNWTCVESGERFDKEATSYVSGDRPEKKMVVTT